MWNEGNIIGINANTSKEHAGVFVSTVYPQYQYNGNGTWSEIDISNLVPVDTKAIFLTGILLITHSGSAGIADFRVHFKKSGAYTYPGDYIGQTVEAHPGGGQRTNFSSWVPVENQKFMFYWYGVPLSGVHYGTNLTIQAYIR